MLTDRNYFEVYNLDDTFVPFAMASYDLNGQVFPGAAIDWTYTRNIEFFPDQVSKVFITFCSIAIRCVDNVTGLKFNISDADVHINTTTNAELWPFYEISEPGLGTNSFPGSIVQVGSQNVINWGAQALGGNNCRITLTGNGDLSTALVNPITMRINITIQGFKAKS